MSVTFKEVKGIVNDVRAMGDIQPVSSQLMLTSFFGGLVRGRSLQIGTNHNGYIQLTCEAVIELKDALELWLSGEPLEEIDY